MLLVFFFGSVGGEAPEYLTPDTPLQPVTAAAVTSWVSLVKAGRRGTRAYIQPPRRRNPNQDPVDED